MRFSRYDSAPQGVALARPVRVSSDLVRLRAAEIRTAGEYRGRPVHFGSRPPAGAIAFTQAVASRLGCSVTLVKRVLGGRDRSGPRRSASDRALSLAKELPVDQVRDALEELIALVSKETVPAAESALLVFANESLPMADRLAPLLAFVTTRVPARKSLQSDRGEGSLWSSPARQSQPVKPPSKSPERVVQEYLAEALDASLGTPNALGVRARELAVELERELRPPQVGRNRA